MHIFPKQTIDNIARMFSRPIANWFEHFPRGTIRFSIYYISEKKINLLCHDLIGPETIYVYAIIEQKIVEMIKKYDFYLNM